MRRLSRDPSARASPTELSPLPTDLIEAVAMHQLALEEDFGRHYPELLQQARAQARAAASAAAAGSAKGKGKAGESSQAPLVEPLTKALGTLRAQQQQRQQLKDDGSAGESVGSAGQQRSPRLTGRGGPGGGHRAVDKLGDPVSPILERDGPSAIVQSQGRRGSEPASPRLSDDGVDRRGKRNLIGKMFRTGR